MGIDNRVTANYNHFVQQAVGSLLPDQVVSDRYQILSYLGGGEATEVYKVRDLVGGRVLALKALRPDAPKDAELRLSREFYHLSRFSHKGIVAALDYGSTAERRPFFTMEFVDGLPITSFFKNGYEPSLVDVTVGILRALDSIHAQGLIHCDLKPANILVTTETGVPSPKLLDFGFAEQMSLTATAQPRGTLGYVAPEVFKGTDADARADLYSLGLVLYEVITGRGPARERNLRQWLKMQYRSDFEPPRSIDPKIPEAFEAVVLSLLQREPERRPHSAAAVIELLTGRQEEAVIEAGPRKYLMAPGFVGRSDELGELRDALDAAGRGKPGAVAVSGDRGVGKSRLLAEFKFLAQLEGATILSCEPVSLGARPQSLIETVLNYLRVYANTVLPVAEEGRGGSEESKYRLFETVAQRLKELSASHRVEHSLVLLVDDFELFDPTSLEFLRYLVFSLEKERLLVLVAGLKEKRFLDLIEELGRRPNSRHIALPPMGRAEVRSLAISLLGDIAAIDSLAEWLEGTTGGNPLFVIETIHSLIEGKILTLRGGRWVLVEEALESYRPPNTVTEVVRRRLEGLSNDELEILQVGAAAAGPFTLEFLRAVSGLDERVLFNAIGRLRSMGLLRSFGGDGQGQFALSSKILEAAVTERLSPSARRDNHRRVALAIELLYPDRLDRLVFDLAHHYTQAGITDRAYSYALKAGTRAREFGLTELALGFYETAFSLAGQSITPRERVELIERVGELREATGRYHEAIDIYKQGMSIVVAESSAGRPALARFLRKLGLVYQKLGNQEESISYLSQALALQRDKVSADYVHILNDLGWSYSTAGQLAKAEEVLTQAMQLVERLRSQDERTYQQLSARTLYNFSVQAYSRRDNVLALQLAERSLAAYEALQDEYYTSKVSQFIATLWWRRGELGRARACYQRYLPGQRKTGDVYFLLRSLQGLGIISQQEGDWNSAHDCYAEALTLAERIGDRAAMVDLYSNIGTTCDERGEWSAAQEHFTRALDLIAGEKGQSPARRAIIMANLAYLRTRQGELEEAERLFAEAEQLAAADPSEPDLGFYLPLYRAHYFLRAEKHDLCRQALGRAFAAVRRRNDRHQKALVHVAAAEYRLACGEFDRAQHNALQALLLLAEVPTSREYAIALRWSGLAKSLLGKPERGTQEIKRSIELLREVGAKYDLALSLVASVQALATADRSDITVDMKMPMAFRPLPQQEVTEAVANLKEAQVLLRGLGATLDARRCDELMQTITQVSATMQLKSRERGEYLKVFYQLSELINLGLDKEDFAERLLDLVIDVTRAERGLLFLVQNDKLVPAAARNVDRTTIEDAETISHSVLRKVKRRGELTYSADALSDPRFNTANSVMLNKIRSLLCVPLRVDSRVIGTIYLDSRITAHLFLEEDKNLLSSVANLLAATIDKSVAFKRLQEEIERSSENILEDAVTGCFLGKSKAIREVYRVIDRIAPTDCTVLLTGETGTGKGVLARLIHSKSDRSAKQFVSINCGALPEQLFESELFGHIKGAFTGAVSDKEGLFETADGGTIFLDEISNTTLGVQAKLLEVLEERVIRRVGATQTRHVDVRLICATNRDLEEEVRAGRFREDLYYRMNVVTIRVPPLRERAADIPLLANYFVKRIAVQLNKPVAGFEDDVLARFAAYPWPGNARELLNVVQRATIMTQKRRITLEDIGDKFQSIQPRTELPTTKRKVIDRLQVVNALRETGGNVSKAAELLSIHRRQLQRLIRRYRIDKTNLV